MKWEVGGAGRGGGEYSGKRKGGLLEAEKRETENGVLMRCRMFRLAVTAGLCMPCEWPWFKLSVLSMFIVLL